MQGEVHEGLQACMAWNKRLAELYFRGATPVTDDMLNSIYDILQLSLEDEDPNGIAQALCLPFGLNGTPSITALRQMIEASCDTLYREASLSMSFAASSAWRLPSEQSVQLALEREYGLHSSRSDFLHNQCHNFISRFLAYSDLTSVRAEYTPSRAIRLLFSKGLMDDQGNFPGQDPVAKAYLLRSIKARVIREMSQILMPYGNILKEEGVLQGRDSCIIVSPAEVAQIHPNWPEHYWVSIATQGASIGAWASFPEHRIDEAVRGRVVWPPREGHEALPPRDIIECFCLKVLPEVRYTL